MNNRDLKTCYKFGEMLKIKYGVADFVIDNSHIHPIVICTMIKTNQTINCMGLPNTTYTEWKHVLQNTFKRVREGEKLGKNMVSYGGGKS